MDKNKSGCVFLHLCPPDISPRRGREIQRRCVYPNLNLSKIKDAEVLFAGKRYDGAVYLCGYAIELWLKAIICKTLHWEGYPSSNKEFEKYQSFRTHDLDVLLHVSGIKHVVKSVFIAEWAVVCDWNPNVRYNVDIRETLEGAKEMIESTKRLVQIWC